jgi:hypothetical protein
MEDDFLKDSSKHNLITRIQFNIPQIFDLKTSTCVYIAIEPQPAVSRWSPMIIKNYA